MEPDGTEMALMMSSFHISHQLQVIIAGELLVASSRPDLLLQSRETANAPINSLSPVIISDSEGIKFYCPTQNQQSLDCTSSGA